MAAEPAMIEVENQIAFRLDTTQSWRLVPQYCRIVFCLIVFDLAYPAHRILFTKSAKQITNFQSLSSTPVLNPLCFEMPNADKQVKEQVEPARKAEVMPSQALLAAGASGWHRGSWLTTLTSILRPIPRQPFLSISSMLNMNGAATPETGPVPSGLPANSIVDVPAKDASASKAVTLPLLQGRTTLAEALEEEENMLFRLAYPSQRFEFFL
ncbi:hypothetical protein DL95DRAFT_410930 [Leptodontidium sp. 2 PMI_412]|nr:hypothetical protein DL95DRAFT_410930 [Leptodontidium sp. 2 PMI_412]